MSRSATVVWTLYMTILCSSGCGGPGVLVMHAQAAGAVREVMTSSRSAILTERRSQQEAAVARATTQAEAQVAVETLRRAWAPILDAYDAAREAHDAWSQALLQAVTKDALEDPAGWLALARQVVEAYVALDRLATYAGLDLPDLPDIVSRVNGGRPEK